MSEKSDYGEINTIRVKKDARYFVASNVPFNDKRLSWEARGVMGYLLSKPDNWQVQMNDLVNQSDAGMKVVRRILAELRKAGYMSRERVTVSHGRFKWITTLYESPELNNSTIYPPRIDGQSIDGGRVNIQSTEKLNTYSSSTTTAPPVMPNVFTVYQNNIGMLTSFTADELKDLENTFTELWVIEAIKEAVLSEVRNMKYIKSILNRWKVEGFKSAKTKLPARGSGKTSVQQDLDTLQKWVEEG